jgi:hypothetical protein
MKSHFSSSLALSFAAAFLVSSPAIVSAQQAAAPFQTPALLIEEGGAFQKVWLMAATKDAIRYRETEISTDFVDSKRSEFQSIYLYDPREYSAALDLYQARKYQEAKEMFAKIKDRFRALQSLENNHSTLSAFYEMEAMRRLGDLEGLSAALQKFVKTPLTRATQLRQIELYVLWDALRTKSWDRLDILAREYANTRLPGDQRAQVGYLHGMALEGLERPFDALIAYQAAMTADAGASEDLARMAALRVLSIFKADPEVANAMKLWGTDDENKNSKGYSNLLEAAGVASLYELALGAGTPLPAEFKPFLQYKPAVES